MKIRIRKICDQVPSCQPGAKFEELVLTPDRGVVVEVVAYSNFDGPGSPGRWSTSGVVYRNDMGIGEGEAYAVMELMLFLESMGMAMDIEQDVREYYE